MVSPEGFRELRHACLLSRKAAAAYLGVCERTIRHWDAGRNRVPWSAVRLLRLLRCGDLGALHDGWAGWTLTPRGELVSGNGYRFEPWRLAVWPLLCEQARFWRRDRARSESGGVGAEPLRWRPSAVGDAASPTQPAPSGCAGSMPNQGRPLPRQTALTVSPAISGANQATGRGEGRTAHASEASGRGAGRALGLVTNETKDRGKGETAKNKGFRVAGQTVTGGAP